MEQQWSHPTGARRWVQSAVIFIADWLPSVALLGACVLLLWQYTMRDRHFEWGDILLPPVIVLIVLVIAHIFIGVVFPFRWSAVRGEFHRRLERRLQSDLENVYQPLPDEVAGQLLLERRQVEKLAGEAREALDWLRQREQAATIAGLYGN